MDKKEREIIEIKGIKNVWLLKEILDITTNKCFYCGKKLKKNVDKIAIFNKPNRVICDNTFCLTHAIVDDENR